MTECLHAVRSNTIREPSADKQGELLDIALQAMATDPADRFASVLDFQKAIRDFLEHADSIRQSRDARLLLLAASETGSYENYSRAAFKFEEAIASWSENQDAIVGLKEAKLSHAESALAKGDFDLGFSLVNHEDESHAPIIKQLQDGVWRRESREKKLKVISPSSCRDVGVHYYRGKRRLHSYFRSQQRGNTTERNRKTRGESGTNGRGNR